MRIPSSSLVRACWWTTVVFFCGCHRPTPAPTDLAATAAEVQLVRPSRGEIVRNISLPATVHAYQDVTLYAKVAGYLKSISVDKGDTVQEGAVLAEIEVPELLADLAKYKADVKVAEIEHQRIAGAQQKAPDLVVPQAVDAAEGRLEVARANLQRAQTLLSFARITAPFSGVITWRWVDPGAFIPAATSGSTAQNAAVLKLMDIRKVRVQVPVPYLEAPFIRKGLAAKVTLEELPGHKFAGTVARYTQALDNASRTMMVEIDLPNPDGYLRPGMFASVTIAVERRTNALLVPSAVVMQERNVSFVFTVFQGIAKKTPIQPGFTESGSVEILEGLKTDDTVIQAKGRAIADGQPVR